MGLLAYLGGILGEDKACAFLKAQKYEILERNFHSKFGEIDIIAKKDGILHFVEVKSSSKSYETSYRVDAKKYEKILKTINYYLLKNDINCDYQLDLLCLNALGVDFRENISV